MKTPKNTAKGGARGSRASKPEREVNDELSPPRTPDELHAWLGEKLEVHAQRTPMIDGHSAPFDYLLHTYFEGAVPGSTGENGSAPSNDCVVWANRGGGKTFLGAVATLLDMLFKPGVQVRILGGSLEQSQRMHEHLRTLCEKPIVRELVDGRPTSKRLRLSNGSCVEVLAASQTSVRGTRVQKLRCDEVDLFDPDVWSAAQLTTRSMKCPAGSPWGSVVCGQVEALSTMHRPYGLMWELVGARLLDPKHTPARQSVHASSRRVFRWGLLDVLESCGDEHRCDSCALWPECRGRAKGGRTREVKPASRPESPEDRRVALGHITVADAIAMRGRVDAITWSAEMLCQRPRRTDAVYPEFDPELHVINEPPVPDEHGETVERVLYIAGMDFGLRSEAVALLARVEHRRDSGGSLRAVVQVIREHAASGQRLERHIERILAWKDDLPEGADLAWIGVDPAGHSRSDQTGVSNIMMLRDAGLMVRARRFPLEQGIRLVRSRLIGDVIADERADGAGDSAHAAASGAEPDPQQTRLTPSLLIHPSCARLIECLQRYHYPSDRPDCNEPVKDGFDHACDALRYMILNLDHPGKTESRRV